jgi:hypothetical protein
MGRVILFVISSSWREFVPWFVACDVISTLVAVAMLVLVLAMLFALSRSDDAERSVDTPRGALFKSKNLKAGSFDGL